MAVVSDYNQDQADSSAAEHTLIMKSCSAVNPNKKTCYAAGDAEKSGMLVGVFPFFCRKITVQLVCEKYYYLTVLL